ncbi:MAG: hypothetical protein MZW92_60400 [Comamonadaceae bacterium]|nr:hypothetical protein [Comamonadaceae bacterium]
MIPFEVLSTSRPAHVIPENHAPRSRAGRDRRLADVGRARLPAREADDFRLRTDAGRPLLGIRARPAA